jgi:exodeoxyribonuclease VII small subunit
MKIDESLQKLEQITHRLEEEDLPLEEALKLFEEGITLAKSVKRELDKAKLKIQKVLEEAKDVFALEDFNVE